MLGRPILVNDDQPETAPHLVVEGRTLDEIAGYEVEVDGSNLWVRAIRHFLESAAHFFVRGVMEQDDGLPDRSRRE